MKCTEEGRLAVVQGSGSDDSHRYVDIIECTVLQSWEPNTEHITCVRPCDEMSVGDGFCDGVNNRDLCDWDGGDCCPSTVLAGMVMPMDEDCTEDCECKDPLALENRRKKRHKHNHWKAR